MEKNTGHYTMGKERREREEGQEEGGETKREKERWGREGERQGHIIGRGCERFCPILVPLKVGTAEWSRSIITHSFRVDIFGQRRAVSLKTELTPAGAVMRQRTWRHYFRKVRILHSKADPLLLTFG